MRAGGVALGMLLAFCRCACALDPALDVSQYAHNAWTVRDGFFRGTVHAVAQTPDGYLWLATEFGPVRFDGVRSFPWEPPSGEPLPSRDISGLLAARDGSLWLGTANGLARWKDGRLTQYPGLAGQGVRTLLEDREGTIWAGSWGIPTGRLCAIRDGSTRCYGADGIFGYSATALLEDSGGTLWVGAGNGLWRWKPGPPKHYSTPGLTEAVSSLIEGDSPIASGKGAVLMATLEGVNQLAGNRIEAYPLPGNVRPKISSLLRDRNGSLWIGTGSQGLFHVHQGRIDRFSHADGLSADDVQGLYEDREGNVWVATTGGIDRFREFAVSTISVKQGLSSDGVMSIMAARDGSVWLSTYEGLNRWKDGRVTVYRKGDGLPGDGASSLGEDDGGRIWVGNLHGTARFENGRIVPVSAIPGGYINSITRGSDGDVWFAQEGDGLFHLLGNGVVTQIPWARLGRTGSPTVMISDPVRGGLWLGSWLGGVAYVRDGQTRESYTPANGLGEGRVTGLKLDPDGALWAATQGGLSRIQKGRVTTLTAKNGLPCDTVHDLIEDDQHSFWLYLSCGMARVTRAELEAWAADPKRKVQTAFFDASDGVKIHAGTYGYNPRMARTRDGRVWFVPLDGISVIDPRHLPTNKLPPPVHIEQITADRKTWSLTLPRHLPPRVRDLEIDYTALSFVAPEKVRFRIRLEGRDADWKDAGTRRQAFYTDLPPRHYQFDVIACNNSGVWNEAGASLEFSIDPAYYQTRWFQALCVAAFIALLWGLYRYRLHQVAHEFNARMEERVSERTRIAHDLHDTLLQSVQGLMLRLQVVGNRLPPGETKDLFEKALEQGDRAIVEGREAVRDLRSSTEIANDLVQAVTTLGEELNSHGSATFRVVVEGRSRDLRPILRDEIYRIAREAVRNAFQHAQASRIEVEIEYGEPMLRIRIRDNGRGIDPRIAEEGRTGHYGLPGLRERAQSIGGQLNVWSAAGAGTEIELSIPGKIAYGRSGPRAFLGLFRKKAG